MSFYDDASLIFLPSGGAGKDTKAYSIKPTNGDGDFTFSRGSNLTATRVDSNGLIEKGRENLLFQSNQFDTTWALDGSTITGGQAGYDGSNNAWLFSKTGAFDGLNQGGLSQSGVSTISIYAKLPSGETDANQLLFRVDHSSGNFSVIFDLTNSDIPIASGLSIAADKVDVGNGWYRCVLSFNAEINKINFRPALNGSVGGSTGSLLYQDAQLEIGLVATEYIESGASTGKAGLLENEPRFDYSGGASCASLLLEPLRTNLVTSEYFEDWDKNGGTTLTTNELISPDGSKNATLVSCPLSGGRVGYDVALTSGTTYTFSVYLKNNGGNTSIDIGSLGTTQLETITIDNDWNRYSTTFTATSTTTSNIRFVSSGSNINMYAFGAQLEEGSYLTSYIPKYSGETASRTADEATLEYSSFNDITIFVESNSEDVLRDGSQQNIHIGNDASQGGAFFLRRSSSSAPKRLVAFFKNNDNSDVFSSYELPTGDSKVAFKYNSTSDACKLFVDGSEVRSATATDITPFDTFILDGAGGKFNSKQLVVFNTELSDDDCITLTS